MKPMLNDKSRALLREVGVIVLGVLIALALGEVADAIRHRVNAHRALTAIRADVSDNTSTLEVRAVAEKCLRNRLAEVSRELDFARRTGRLHDISEIGVVPTRSYRTGNWDTAVSNGDSLYMNADTVAELTDYFESLRSYRTLREDAALNWARLAVLVHAPGRIDDNTLSSSRLILREIAYQQDDADLIASLLFNHQKNLKIPVEYGLFNGERRSREQVVSRTRQAPICQSLVIDGKTATIAG